jgi:hypothetical protein
MMLQLFGELQTQSLKQLQILNFHLISLSDLFNGHAMFMFSLPTVSNLIHLFLYTLLRSGRTTHTQSNRWFFPTDMQFKVEVRINSTIPCCSFHFGGKKFQKKAV